jgi:predicted transcriptional regulator
MKVKEQVLLAMERLPEDADFMDVKDEIAFLAALQEAEDDIAAGRTVTNEEVWPAAKGDAALATPLDRTSTETLS